MKNKNDVLTTLKLVTAHIKQEMNANYGLKARSIEQLSLLYDAYIQLKRLRRRSKYLPTWYIKFRMNHILTVMWNKAKEK